MSVTLMTLPKQSKDNIAGGYDLIITVLTESYVDNISTV